MTKRAGTATAQGSSASSRWLKVLAVSTICLFCLGAYGWNVSENRAALQRLDEACACAVDSADRAVEAAGPVIARLFGEDAETVRGLLSDEATTVCDEVRSELPWWKWNAGRSFRLTPRPEEAARTRALLERAAPGCPALFVELLGPTMRLDEAGARELCDALFEDLGPRQIGPPEPLPAWLWPAAIQSSMCVPETVER